MELRGFVYQRSDIGVGAASYYGEAVSSVDGVNGGWNEMVEVSEREGGVGVYYAEEMVRDAAAFFLSDLIGNNVETFVDLDLVGVYDLRREPGG